MAKQKTTSTYLRINTFSCVVIFILADLFVLEKTVGRERSALVCFGWNLYKHFCLSIQENSFNSCEQYFIGEKNNTFFFLLILIYWTHVNILSVNLGLFWGYSKFQAVKCHCSEFFLTQKPSPTTGSEGWSWRPPLRGLKLPLTQPVWWRPDSTFLPLFFVSSYRLRRVFANHVAVSPDLKSGFIEFF